MKKSSTNQILVIVLTVFLLFGTSSIGHAQNIVTQQGDITVGGGLTLTTGVGTGGGGEIGVNGGGYYAITDDIRAGLGVSLFFGDFAPTQINIDGHYLFKNEDNLVLYGLAGLGYWRWSFDTGFGSFSVTTTGLNLGAGAEYVMDSFILFGEAKVNTIGGTPFNITGGVRIRI